MSAKLKEQLGLLADKADNFIAATQLKLPPEFHVKGLKGGMEDIAKELREIIESL